MPSCSLTVNLIPILFVILSLFESLWIYICSLLYDSIIKKKKNLKTESCVLKDWEIYLCSGFWLSSNMLKKMSLWKIRAGQQIGILNSNIHIWYEQLSQSYFHDTLIISWTLKVYLLLPSFDKKLSTTTQNITCSYESILTTKSTKKFSSNSLRLLGRKLSFQVPSVYFCWFLMDILNHGNIPRPVRNRIEGIAWLA